MSAGDKLEEAGAAISSSKSALRKAQKRAAKLGIPADQLATLASAMGNLGTSQTSLAAAQSAVSQVSGPCETAEERKERLRAIIRAKTASRSGAKMRADYVDREMARKQAGEAKQTEKRREGLARKAKSSLESSGQSFSDLRKPMQSGVEELS